MTCQSVVSLHVFSLHVFSLHVFRPKLMCGLAGHGSQTKDWSGDERDGMNETLCPCDFKQVNTGPKRTAAASAVLCLCSSAVSPLGMRCACLLPVKEMPGYRLT